MNYLIYARVSPKGSSFDFDRETSIEMQIDTCKKYISTKQGTVIKIVKDEFCSGSNLQRPGIQQIITELEAGFAEWDTIIVYKLSRLSRSLRDGADFFAMLFQNAKGFASATENYDFYSPIGRAHLGMMQVFNQLEREQTAENTRNRMLSIAEKGLWPSGRTPFGYCRGEKGDNRLYADKEKAPILKKIFKMYTGNYTTLEIAAKFQGVISKNQILTCLRNRIYLGKMVYAGKEFPGQHEPLVSPEVFKAVQQKLPLKTHSIRPKAQKYPYLLAGLLRCHCGRFMTPTSAKSGKYHYYSCTDKINCKFCVSAPNIEKQVLEKVKTIKFSKHEQETIRNELQCIIDEDKQFLLPELKILRESLLQAKANEQFYKERYFSETERVIQKKVGQEWVKAQEQTEIINEQISSIQNKLKGTNISIDKHVKEILNTLQSFRDDLRLYPNDPDRQRQIIIANIESIRSNGDKSYNIALAYSRSSSNCTVWLPDQDSNLD